MKLSGQGVFLQSNNVMLWGWLSCWECDVSLHQRPTSWRDSVINVLLCCTQVFHKESFFYGHQSAIIHCFWGKEMWYWPPSQQLTLTGVVKHSFWCLHQYIWVGWLKVKVRLLIYNFVWSPLWQRTSDQSRTVTTVEGWFLLRTTNEELLEKFLRGLSFTTFKWADILSVSTSV